MGIFSGSDDEQPDWSEVIALDNEIKRLNQCIKELESKNGINWISVKEHKLPKDRKILALHCGSIICIYWDENRSFWRLDGIPAACLLSEINNTHWAEINEPESN